MPSDLQNHILKSEAINESRNQWYEHFKILVTTTFPNPDDSDDMDNILAQAEWEDYFGSSTRVYENKHSPTVSQFLPQSNPVELGNGRVIMK